MNKRILYGNKNYLFLILFLFISNCVFSLTADQIDISKILKEPDSVEIVTMVLNQIQSLSKQEAGIFFSDLLKIKARIYLENQKNILNFFQGVTSELLENTTDAILFYNYLCEEEIQNLALKTSADFRIKKIEASKPKAKKGASLFLSIIKKEKESEGWFIIDKKWTYSTNHTASYHELVTIRSKHLYFRFFEYLKSLSPFPLQYAYLFILLIITAGIRLLAFPLHLRRAKFTIQIQRLAPDIRRIQSMYADDPVTINQETMQLYRTNNVNILGGGCAPAIVFLIFAILGFYFLGEYSPQLALDGAIFFWIKDIGSFDWWILLIFCVAALFIAIPQMKTQLNLGQSMVGLIIVYFIFGLIAWLAKWPAYIFIFWLILSLSDTFMHLFSLTICKITQRVRGGIRYGVCWNKLE